MILKLAVKTVQLLLSIMKKHKKLITVMWCARQAVRIPC